MNNSIQIIIIIIDFSNFSYNGTNHTSICLKQQRFNTLSNRTMECCIETSILSIWGEFGCDKNLLKQQLKTYPDDDALMDAINQRLKAIQIIDIDTIAGGVL